MNRLKHFLPFMFVVSCLMVHPADLSAQTKQKGETSVSPQSADDAGVQRKLKEELAAFEKFAGEWVIDGKWMSGGDIWAKNVYSVGMNGNFFEAKTYAKNEHDKEYQRYHTIWRYNPEKEKVESYGFTFDGTVTITDSELDLTDVKHPLIRSQWRSSPESPMIKQEVRLIDDESYGWKVWSSEDGKEWEQMMDGVWKKTKS